MISKLKFNGKYNNLGTYSPVKVINKGDKATVYLAKCSLRFCYVIVKIANEGQSDKWKKKSIYREVNFLKKMSHPYIINLYEYQSEPVFFLVEEYCMVSTLRQFYNAKNKKLEWHNLIDIYSKLLAVINYINSMGYIYLDIKTQNILYDGNIFKLIDYGLIKVPGIYGRLGSRQTMSPEQARGSYVDFSADVWGIGSILFLLLTGKFPYDFVDSEKYPQIDMQPKNIFDLVDIPKWLGNDLMSMLSSEAKNRPSTSELIISFNKYNKL